MTVKELINELEGLDPNLIVIYSTMEDCVEPTPSVQCYDFDHSYYTGKEFITIPKNQPFVTL